MPHAVSPAAVWPRCLAHNRAPCTAAAATAMPSRVHHQTHTHTAHHASAPTPTPTSTHHSYPPLPSSGQNTPAPATPLGEVHVQWGARWHAHHCPRRGRGWAVSRLRRGTLYRVVRISTTLPVSLPNCLPMRLVDICAPPHRLHLLCESLYAQPRVTMHAPVRAQAAGAFARKCCNVYPTWCTHPSYAYGCADVLESCSSIRTTCFVFACVYVRRRFWAPGLRMRCTMVHTSRPSTRWVSTRTRRQARSTLTKRYHHLCDDATSPCARIPSTTTPGALSLTSAEALSLSADILVQLVEFLFSKAIVLDPCSFEVHAAGVVLGA